MKKNNQTVSIAAGTCALGCVAGWLVDSAPPSNFIMVLSSLASAVATVFLSVMALKAKSVWKKELTHKILTEQCILLINKNHSLYRCLSEITHLELKKILTDEKKLQLKDNLEKLVFETFAIPKIIDSLLGNETKFHDMQSETKALMNEFTKDFDDKLFETHKLFEAHKFGLQSKAVNARYTYLFKIGEKFKNIEYEIYELIKP